MFDYSFELLENFQKYFPKNNAKFIFENIKWHFDHKKKRGSNFPEKSKQKAGRTLSNFKK